MVQARPVRWVKHGLDPVTKASLSLRRALSAPWGSNDIERIHAVGHVNSTLKISYRSMYEYSVSWLSIL